MEAYPKKIELKDGAVLTLRTMNRDDQNALYKFFTSLPAASRRFLRNDVTDKRIIEKWVRDLNFEKVLPILAEFEGRIVANVSLHRQTFGWGRHVGEIRIAVADDFRGRGLSSVLLDEVSHVAARQGLKKIVARVITSRQGTMKAFHNVGFQNVAVLKRYVKDIYQKRYADIAILVKELTPVSEQA